MADRIDQDDSLPIEERETSVRVEGLAEAGMEEDASEGLAPVEPTVIFPERLPSFDEEHGTYIGEHYEQDFSRLGRAYQDPRADLEVLAPRMVDDGGGYRVPGEGRSRSKARPLIAMLIILPMIAAIAAAGAYGLELWGGKRLANVCGLTEARACSELEDQGFVVEVRTRIADDGIGLVLEQEPDAGTRLEEGERVTVVVASNREMPEVVGLTQEEAEALLTKAGAGEVRVVAVDSKESEGTVISVDPPAGEAFTAHQTVVLKVSQKPVVPDVVGKTRSEATAVVESVGLKAEVELVTSDKTPNTVIEQSPAPETKVDPGATVHLTVSKPKPSNALHLLEYFSRSASANGKLLTDQGFSRTSSYGSGGYAEAVYSSGDKGKLIFTARPFSHVFDYGANTGEDVFAKGLTFLGVRWEVPSSMLPEGASSLSESAALSLMSTCGLSNYTYYCTHDDLIAPGDTQSRSERFICIYGEDSGYAWTVLIENDGGTRAVVTAMPKSLYTDVYDLEPYGYSICDMVAYIDVYTER